MKVIQKGNVYRRANWLKEHEEDIYKVLCAIAGEALFIITMLLINYK